MRLRRLVDEALVEYAIEPVRVRLLSNDFNGIFRVDTADGDRVVVRVVLPSGGHQPHQVAAQAMFAEAVAGGTDLLVPVPIRNRRGDLVTVASAPGVPEPRMCLVTSWVPGVDLAERMSGGNWERLGRLMARLHTFAESWSPPEGFETITYDRVVHFGEPVVLFEPQAEAVLSTGQQRVLERAIARIDARIASLSGPRIVTHGDLHQWNVKVDRTRLHPIDFEDLQWAHPLQDVATTFYYLRRRDDRSELAGAFRRGYAETRPWVEEDEGEVAAHVVARGIDLVNFVIWCPEEDAGEYRELIDGVVEAARELG